MRMSKPSESRTAPDLSAADHLRAQLEIERRAHDLWRSRGCRPNAGLADWIEAEGEILEALGLARLGSRLPRPGSRKSPGAAYELYEERGRQDGQAAQNWGRGGREIRKNESNK